MIAGGVTLHNNNNDKKKYFNDEDDEQNKEKIEMTNMRVANTRDKPEIMEPSTSKRMKVDGKLHLSPPHTVSLLWSDDDDDGDGKKGKDYEKDRDDETAQIYRISSSMANLCLPASSSFSSDKMSDGTQPMMMKRLNASLSSGLSKLDGVSEKVKKKCYGSTPTLIEGHNPSGVLECGDNDDECYGFFADLDDDEDDNCLSSTRYYEDPYRESTQRGSFACEVASLAFTAPVAPASIRVSVEQDAKIVWAQAADTVDDCKFDRSFESYGFDFFTNILCLVLSDFF